MKKPQNILPILLLIAHGIFATNSNDKNLDFKQQKYAGICFTENKGQVHDLNYKSRPDVLFGAMAGPMAFYLRNNGVSYQLYRIDKWKETVDSKTREVQKEIEEQTIYRVDVNWVSANSDYNVIADDVFPGYNNYYLESCPNGALYVKSYKGVTLQNLYDGINLHYYEKEGQLKHDYIVKPGADFKQIQLKIEGATIETNDGGSLILNTPLGKIEEGSPLVFQRGRVLKSKWVIQNNTLSFEIEDYNSEYELVIDPVTRVWGTYYGGSSDEYGSACSTDASGNVYMSGRSDSNTGDVIATSGSHQQTSGGFSEAYLVKFNPKGLRLWGTYYGGSGAESSNACATDGFGNVYMAGTTSSGSGGNVIATPGAHQQSYGGVSADAFLVKFNGSGIRQWGTYYGSFGWDIAWSCATDAFGNVYMAGKTDSGSLIATQGSHQQGYGGGYNDAFLVKFDSVGVRQWGTYYGGNDDEDGRSCSTDALGNVYLTGSTYNIPGTVIATAGSHQQNFGGGSLDAYLVKFNSSGVRQWGTYYGGYYYDYGYSCATDASGNVYLAGNTNGYSSTLIATPGSHQPNFVGGSVDAFLVKFNSSGIRQWGTYYGDYGIDDGFSCATDKLGNVYLGGRTSSGGSMASIGVFQPNYGGGTYDAYLAKFSGSGIRQWATYFGENTTDYGHSCATDVFGNVFLAGETTSSTGTAIATPGSHQESTGGLLDAFLVKITDCVVLNTMATIDSIVCVGNDINLAVTLTGTGSYTYNWAGPNNYSSTQQNPVIFNASNLAVGIYTVTVINGNCGDIATAELKVVDVCEGIGNLGAYDGFFVYPNPSANTLNIEIQSPAKYYFSDLLGRELANGELAEGKNSLDLTQVEKGCYLLLITDGRFAKTVKVVKD